jgi:transcriptional regulator with XRE-family HTH domain
MIGELQSIEEVFAYNLKKLRGKSRQEDTADAIGIPFRTYQDMESGTIPVKKRDEVLRALSTYYRVPVTQFFLDPDLAHTPRPDSLRQILSILATLSENQLENVLSDLAAMQSKIAGRE